MDHFGEQRCLAHTGAAEKSGLAAAFQRHEHIDHFDARFKNLRFRGTTGQRRRRAMHGTPLDISQRRFAIDGVAKHIEHPRENPFADRSFQRSARVLHGHTASETLRGRQCNPSHVLRIASRQRFDDGLSFSSRAQHQMDRRQMRIEPDIHDAAAHGYDRAEIR